MVRPSLRPHEKVSSAPTTRSSSTASTGTSRSYSVSRRLRLRRLLCEVGVLKGARELGTAARRYLMDQLTVISLFLDDTITNNKISRTHEPYPFLASELTRKFAHPQPLESSTAFQNKLS